MHPNLGFVLSLLTAALWGSLPIALRPVVQHVDPITVTWCRYLVAAIGLGIFLAYQGQLPKREQFAGYRWLLMLAALAGFAGNNFGFLAGLRLTSPSTAQVVIQVAPILVIFGAVFLFGESFGRMQWLGVGAMLGGILTFFHQRLASFGAGGDQYLMGVMMLLGSAVLWAGYALAQKKLLLEMNSVTIMFIIYVAGSILMAPAASPAHLASLDSTRLSFLIYCCLNSLVSYGFFSEALAIWPASKVSAVVALAPLFTVIFTKIASTIWPAYVAAEALDALNLLGAAMVVGGCVMMALAGRMVPVPEE